MGKSKQKTKYNSYNQEIIKKLKAKYGLSVSFIGASLRGDRTSETSDKIVEDYKKIEAELKKTLDNLK